MNGNTDVENYQIQQQTLKELELKHIRLDERYKQLMKIKEDLITEIRNHYNLYDVNEDDLLQKLREIMKSNMAKRKETISGNHKKIVEYEEQINNILELLKTI